MSGREDAFMLGAGQNNLGDAMPKKENWRIMPAAERSAPPVQRLPYVLRSHRSEAE